MRSEELTEFVKKDMRIADAEAGFCFTRRKSLSHEVNLGWLTPNS